MLGNVDQQKRKAKQRKKEERKKGRREGPKDNHYNLELAH